LSFNGPQHRNHPKINAILHPNHYRWSQGMSSSSGYTLLTGATGLVGSVLMRDLLCKRERVAVLVRPTRQQAAAERIESILQPWESCATEPIARPVCLTGVVNAPNLGLDAESQQWLARHCTRVIHNAAILKFTATSRHADPWKTNFGGTQRTLELCRKLGLRDFHYMSTAYVCGRRHGVIREPELEMGQGFRNDYEQSKYLAERLVRADDFIAPATIYRPVVIGGDSQTGYTNTYHGIYVYMRLLDVLMTNTRPGPDGRRYAPLRIVLDGNERRNIVPVDWVSNAVCQLLDNPAARGRTFHLAPRVPITTGEFFAAAYRYFNAHGYEFCGRNSELTGDITVFERAFLTHRTPYEDYELTDPRFDTANLERFTGELPCPTIDETVLHRYLRFGAQDKWGTRPTQRGEVRIWTEDLLRQTIASSLREWPPLALSACTLGLDVVGPGGGQWQLASEAFQSPTILPGLPPGAQPVLRLSVDRLARLLGVSPAYDARASDPRSRLRSLLTRLAAFLAKDRISSAATRRRAG
jgi:thioester reductase-like protein